MLHLRRMGAGTMGDPSECTGILELHVRIYRLLIALCIHVSFSLNLIRHDFILTISKLDHRCANLASFPDGRRVLMQRQYWLVHRGRVSVPAMYDPNGIYRYVGGFNWRAIIALLVTVTPCLPGLANAVNTSVDVGSALRLYQISSLYGVSTSPLHFSG